MWHRHPVSDSANREAPRGRLAPSPTGALHLGNARTFLIAWLSVRARGGTVLLRMEDLDHPKHRPGVEDEVLEDLRWLGLNWDEGPDVGGPFAPYTQSERRPHYRDALDRLLADGRVYPCVCSRRDVEEAQSAPHDTAEGLFYPGTCRDQFRDFDAARRRLDPERIPAWRFRAAPGHTEFKDGFHGKIGRDVAGTFGDFALARDVDGAGYTLAVVVDDAAMGVDEVIRGDDLLPATTCQVQVYEALGLPTPRFTHVPLVVGPDGRRLAKRHGDTRLAALRDAGVPAARIVGMLAASCGWVENGVELTPADLVPLFDLDAIPRDPFVLTPERLEQLR
jgi:glutamyl-tRNA synthetase